MPDADELEGARRLAAYAFAELSQHDLSSSCTSPPPRVDLPPLLRCCLLLLPLLNGDLAVRCARRLLDFARGILSRDPDRSLLPAVEMFAENLVVSEQLRWRLNVADGAIPKRSRVELRLLLELMTHHFISSVQDETGFEQFLRAISWSGKEMQESPEIGLLGAISLVNRCCLFSMPVTVQAHFVSLASRCVANEDLNQHLLVFDYAMNAYFSFLPALGVFTKASGVKSLLKYCPKKRPFKSFIEAATYQKLQCQINRLLSFCKLHPDADLLTNERDIFDASVHFIEENRHLIHEQVRQEVVIAVKNIVSNMLCCAKKKHIHELDAIVSEEIISLAAVLRLVGTVSLQIMQCITQMKDADDGNKENYLSFCKQYNFISETIRLLGQYEYDEIHRYDLFGMIGKPVDKDRASMLMLAHFATLSICCLTMRFGFLWKGCIIMMMAAMNLVIAEERTLGLFHCFDGSKNSVFFSMDEDHCSKVSFRRKSSKTIAVRFKNLHKVRIHDDVRHDFVDGSSSGNLVRCKSIDGKDDRRAIFGHLPGYKHNSSEWDDIMDFIECQPCMDYSSWWTQHKKFKKYMDDKWKEYKRLAVNKNKREKISRHMDEKRNRCKRLCVNKNRTLEISRRRL